jgi:hypothetical protein
MWHQRCQTFVAQRKALGKENNQDPIWRDFWKKS